MVPRKRDPQRVHTSLLSNSTIIRRLTYLFIIIMIIIIFFFFKLPLVLNFPKSVEIIIIIVYIIISQLMTKYNGHSVRVGHMKGVTNTVDWTPLGLIC